MGGYFPDSPRTSLHTLNIFNFRYFYIHPCFILLWAGITQSVLRLATGWTVRGSNPSRGEVFRTRPDRPCRPPSLLYNEYRIFPGGKAVGAWRWPPTPSGAEVKERVQLYTYSPSGPSWPVLGWTVPLPFYFISPHWIFTRNYMIFNTVEWFGHILMTTVLLL